MVQPVTTVFVAWLLAGALTNAMSLQEADEASAFAL